MKARRKGHERLRPRNAGQEEELQLRPIEVKVAAEWVAFFRRNLVSPHEFGGALDFGRSIADRGRGAAAATVDSAAVIFGNEEMVDSLDYLNEIGYHTHPATLRVIFAPSGADYEALISGATRYYGGLLAPNQQCSLVFSASGTWALYPTPALLDRAERVLDTARREVGAGGRARRATLDRELGQPIRALTDQALHADEFLLVAPKNLDRRNPDNVILRGRLDARLTYAVTGPPAVAQTLETQLRTLVRVPATIDKFVAIQEIRGWFPEDLVTLFNEPKDNERQETQRAERVRDAAVQMFGPEIEVRLQRQPLTLLRMQPPMIAVRLEIGRTPSGPDVSTITGQLPPYATFEVTFHTRKHSADSIQWAVTDAWQQTGMAARTDPLSRDAWIASILGPQSGSPSLLDAVADRLHDSVAVDVRTTFYFDPADVSDIHFYPESKIEKGRLAVPRWALDPGSEKMRLVRDTAAALGYRLDFFAGDQTPVLDIVPVEREPGRVLPFGLRRLPNVLVRQPAPFAQRPPVRTLVPRSYRFGTVAD